jgi:hypothetical protein
MIKLNKTQLKSLNELVEANQGACIVSEWVTGMGRYTKRRTIPAYCGEFILWKTGKDNQDSSLQARLDFICEYYDLRGFARQAIKRVLKTNPRASSAIVCADIRRARKALKSLKD